MNMKIKKNRVSNDPIGDVLTRLRNAIAVSKKTVTVPYSKLKAELAALLLKEGYISSYKIVNEEEVAAKGIEITLK